MSEWRTRGGHVSTGVRWVRGADGPDGTSRDGRIETQAVYSMTSDAATGHKEKKTAKARDLI